jgi:transposase-like protein
MAGHRTDEERGREVEGWRSSGEGVRQYATRRGYSETTLRKWIRAAEARPWVSAPGLVRLVPRSAVEAGETESELVVEVGGARVRVRRGFDAALLRGVVSALSERAS